MSSSMDPWTDKVLLELEMKKTFVLTKEQEISLHLGATLLGLFRCVCRILQN